MTYTLVCLPTTPPPQLCGPKLEGMDLAAAQIDLIPIITYLPSPLVPHNNIAYIHTSSWHVAWNRRINDWFAEYWDVLHLSPTSFLQSLAPIARLSLSSFTRTSTGLATAQQQQIKYASPTWPRNTTITLEQTCSYSARAQYFREDQAHGLGCCARPRLLTVDILKKFSISAKPKKSCPKESLIRSEAYERRHLMTLPAGAGGLGTS